MKVKVNEAERETLDWMVVMAEWVGHEFVEKDRFLKIFLHQNRTGQGYCYSRDWAKAGPIIERERIYLSPFSDYWEAQGGGVPYHDDTLQTGPTPLIAAMRCFVASKLGDECDIPDELITGE